MTFLFSLQDYVILGTQSEAWRTPESLRTLHGKGDSGQARMTDVEPEEIGLLRSLYRFSEIVEEAAENFAPHIICNYLFDLSQKFNLFYQRLPILHPVRDSSPSSAGAQNDNVRDLRLALTAAVGQVIKNGLHLLGIKAPERM